MSTASNQYHNGSGNCVEHTLPGCLSSVHTVDMDSKMALYSLVYPPVGLDKLPARFVGLKIYVDSLGPANTDSNLYCLSIDANAIKHFQRVRPPFSRCKV